MQILRALRLPLSMVLLAWVATRAVQAQGVDGLVARLQGLHVGWLWVAVTLQLSAIGASTVRWHGLLRAEGAERGLMFWLRHTLIGRFVGAFTPSTTGIDGYRLVAALRAGTAAGAASRALVIEKCTGLLALALICGACAVAGAAGFSGAGAWTATVLCAAGAGAGWWLLLRLRAIASRLPTRVRRHPWAARVLREIPDQPPSARTSAVALGWALLSHGATSGVFVATAWALGIALPWQVLFAVGNAIVLATLLPISVGGVGVREGTAVMLLGGAGVASGDAALVAVLGYLAGQVPTLLGGGLSCLDAYAADHSAISSPTLPAKQ